MQAEDGVIGQRQRGQHQPFHHAVAHVVFRAAILAGALGGQQDLVDDAQPRQRAVAVGQGQAADWQLVALGPGLAVGGHAQTDLVQQRDEVVGVGLRAHFFALIGVGRGVLGAQRGNVRTVHGRFPCKACGTTALNKGGGRYVCGNR